MKFVAEITAITVALALLVAGTLGAVNVVYRRGVHDTQQQQYVMTVTTANSVSMQEFSDKLKCEFAVGYVSATAPNTSATCLEK